jgi:hypothetical protein
MTDDPGLELYDLQRPYRANWITDGAADDGWIGRVKPARIRVFPLADGRAQTISLKLDLPLSDVPASRYVVRAGTQIVTGRVTAGTQQGESEVTLCLPGGAPREVSVGTRAAHLLRDGRHAGVRLQAIRVVPRERAC